MVCTKCGFDNSDYPDTQICQKCGYHPDEEAINWEWDQEIIVREMEPYKKPGEIL